MVFESHFLEAKYFSEQKYECYKIQINFSSHDRLGIL